MRDEIYWTITCTVKPGRFEELEHVVGQLVAATREETGSIAYDYSADPSRTTVRVFEAYASSRDAELHMTQTFSRFADDFSACADLVDFVVYGEPEPALKSMLDQQNCVYFAPFEGFLRKS
ncbi:antibiotic biosynthesis monooxygenase [Micromonospora sp. CPCC 205371]|nr:antibiotic biosynthesis monooxygenase [Micromonospora sp. CPCC 205371]